MVDKVNPIITIMLDRERHLKLSFGAMRDYDKVTGKHILNGEYDEKSPGDILTLLWAMLSQEDEMLTLKQVDNLLDLRRMKEFCNAINKAILLAMPEKAEGDAVPLAEKSQPG